MMRPCLTLSVWGQLTKTKASAGEMRTSKGVIVFYLADPEGYLKNKMFSNYSIVII